MVRGKRIEEHILSASKIKTFEDCGWVYWAKYHLGLPDSANEGSARGSICHMIFELLMIDKHKHHYDSIIENKGIEKSPSIQRLVRKHLKSYKFDTQENYDMINKMVYVGANHDFFEENGELGEPEYAFVIENKKRGYKIRGFIDKHAFYDEDTLIITDYKSSKGKYRGEELHSNVQAMMYTLAGKKIRNKLKKIKVRFLFLRFPRTPIQELEFSKDEIEGFEYYLGWLNGVMNDFNENDAVSNFAADKPDKRWFCAAGKTWVCPLRDPFEYYALVDSEGYTIASSKEKSELKLDPKFEIKKMMYLGCPRHHNVNPKEAIQEA